jgi:hypothetical protein
VTREAAIAGTVERFKNAQWSLWPLGADLEQRLRSVLEERFEDLFISNADGFFARWITPGHEILITWQPASKGL